MLHDGEGSLRDDGPLGRPESFVTLVVVAEKDIERALVEVKVA